MEIRAVLFDMDGTLSDTQKLHAQVESEILSRFGVKITPNQITEKYAGVRTRDFMAKLINGAGHKPDMKEVLKNKWDTMSDLVNLRVDPIPGAIELVERCLSADLKLAVVTASPTLFTRRVLDKIGLRHVIRVVITGDNVSHSKPDPEGFLMAAKAYKLVPPECVVIEDGVSGMEAAERAGMACIGLIARPHQVVPATICVMSLTHVTIPMVLGMKKYVNA